MTITLTNCEPPSVIAHHLRTFGERAELRLHVIEDAEGERWFLMPDCLVSVHVVGFALRHERRPIVLRRRA